MRSALSLAVVLGLLLAPAAWAADVAFEVIPVRNRPAADLVAPLEAVLGDQVTVTAFDGKLIVRGDRRLLPEVRRLVARLDVRPRSLMITVRQERDVEAEARSAAGTVVVGSGGAAVGGHLAQGRGTEVSGDVHQVRALEGTPAWITLGESIPVPTTVVTPAPGGAAVVSGTAWQQADRGFWVVARVAGEQVTLEIETALDEAGPAGTLETQGVSTTAAGRLGEWISLGEIAREQEAGGSGILSAGHAQRSELRTIQVKVDDLP